MAYGPVLIFDKSTLESLSVDEAVLLDNFYLSNIIPIFFVECLADLEKNMVRMSSTPEQLVGSLALRTPDSQSVANVYHLHLLKGELSGQFDLATTLLRPVRGEGERVKLGEAQGVIYKVSQEEESVARWIKHQFLNLEREVAKGWREMISQIDLDQMSKNTLDSIGPWRKPTSLRDARALTDLIIDSLDPEWLLRFGIGLLGVPEAIEHVIDGWKGKRKPPLRKYLPYFIHLLSVNVFFCLVLPTQLLKNVKASHHIDLAYLYYLPFCAVFTSRDNFHVQVAPLFMSAAQQFVHGDDLKADLKRLNESYQALPADVREQGLINFARHPPNDDSYLTTRLWDAYLPRWRSSSAKSVDPSPELQQALKDIVKNYKVKAKQIPENDVVRDDQLDYVQISKKVAMGKGSYLRFSREQISQIEESEKKRLDDREPGQS